MIRRIANRDYLLITQHDHALLAGQLVQHVGNSTFTTPSPYRPTVDAVLFHDSGWPLRDDRPALNAQSLPLHVFETPVEISVRVWDASVDRAAALDPYAGLLVSIHVMGLSAISMAHHADPHDRFKLNRFQLHQAERQLHLRNLLQMRTDLPLHFGLAKPNLDPTEDQLLFNLRLLQAMDRLSLVLCCSEHLFAQIDGVLPRPGAPELSLKLTKLPTESLCVDPWPFDQPNLRFDIPCRRLPARVFADESDFHRVYDAAPSDRLSLHLQSS